MSIVTPCCNYKVSPINRYPVYWNIGNKVVQCHNCGVIYTPSVPTAGVADPKRGPATLEKARNMGAHEFELAFAALVNSYSLENISNTPDFILAEFTRQVFDAFNKATIARSRWYDSGKVKAIVPPAEFAPVPMDASQKMLCGCGFSFYSENRDKLGCPNCNGQHEATPYKTP